MFFNTLILIEQLIKFYVKVKSFVHLNTLQPLMQRMRGIFKANNKLYLYMIISKKIKKDEKIQESIPFLS